MERTFLGNLRQLLDVVELLAPLIGPEAGDNMPSISS
jgi:hypothetical protein